MLLLMSCLAMLLSSALAHMFHKPTHQLPPPNPHWRCPCPRPLCSPVTAEYRSQSFGFLDLSRRPGGAAWLALPALTAVVVSHESLDEEPRIVAAMNSSLAALFCRSRRHGVRLLYRLRVAEPVSPALHRLAAVFALLPFDGISLRIDDALLAAPGRAENATLRAVGLARRLRPGAWVMLEQPSLHCSGCAWMHQLSRRAIDFLFLPAFSDNDCPSSAFAAAAEVERVLGGTAAPDRIVLGAALFGLRFDCDAGDEDGCKKNDACPSRVAPRDLWATRGRQQFGRFLQQTEADSREALLRKLRLARRRNLAGFGLVHANDLTANSSAEFWREVASYKEVVYDQLNQNDMAVFFLILILLLILI